MALSREEMRKVALLARLELSDSELEEQSLHFNALLEQFEILQAVDVTNVEPTSHPMSLVNVLRTDTVRPSLTQETALANTPDRRDGYIVVPRIVEA